MMHILEDFFVKCNTCGHMTLVEADSLDCTPYVYDRPMGDEVEYNFRGEVCCEECHSWITLNIQGYEYPVGAFNFSSFHCSGGEFVRDPQIEIVYEFDFNYYDDAYDKYDKAQVLLEYHKRQIENMSHREFEYFVADIFKKLGFSVKVTQATRDGGADIIATKSYPFPYTLLVECKHWGPKHKVDVSVVRSVYGVQVANQVNQSVIVTSSEFTRDARKFAEGRKSLMALWDIDDLLKLM